MTTESTNGVTELASAVRRAGTAPLPITAAAPLTDAEVFGSAEPDMFDDARATLERAQAAFDRLSPEQKVTAERMVKLDLADDDAFNNPLHIVEAQDEPTPEPAPIAPETAISDSGTNSDDDEDEPWPHETIEFAGQPLQVRKPSSQAMVAFSLVNGTGTAADVQMRIFAAFVRKHLSPESFEAVVGRMIDPDDDEVSIEGLMKALVSLE